MNAPEPVVVIVPCFNEASRLDVAAFESAIAKRPEWWFTFVDDGSTDGTGGVLERVSRLDPGRVSVLRLRRNTGKGEAVRHGMRAGLDAGAGIICCLDADLSTPFMELDRLVRRLTLETELDAVLGSRVRRLGTDIRRTAIRHYLGRVFATGASLALGVGVYDTQCGAKAFRGTLKLAESLATPFSERWAFDVELLSRLTRAPNARSWGSIVEEPLLVWHDRPGSKLSALEAVRAGVELLRIGYRHRRGREPERLVMPGGSK